jgi:hypothetical protein
MRIMADARHGVEVYTEVAILLSAFSVVMLLFDELSIFLWV